MTKIQTLDSNKQLINKIGYVIMYLMVGFIPHIYRYMNYVPSTSESIYFKEPMYADLYMLAKSKFFLVLTAILVCIFIVQLIQKHMIFIKDKITICTGIFAGIVILSSVMSEYQDIVYWGAKDRFEGMWVWLAYLIVFTITRHYGGDKLFINRLLNVFVCSASIMAIFGLMQIYGYDIYTDGPLRWLAFPNEIASNMELYMTANTTETLAVGALYNSNYFGVYCAVAAMGGLILSLKDNILTQLVFGTAVVLNYCGMIASRSEAALLGFAVALLVLFISNTSAFWKVKWYTIVLFVAVIFADRQVVGILSGNQSENARYIYFMMIAMVLLGVTLHVLLTRVAVLSDFVKKHSLILAIVSVAIVIIGFNVAYKYVPVSENGNLIEKLTIEENQLFLKMISDEDMTFEFLMTGVNAYGEDDQPIVGTSDGENGMILKSTSETYRMSFRQYSNGYVATLTNPINFNVFYDGTGIQYVDRVTGAGEIQHPRRFEYYNNKANTFSKRGYIWGTYMPVMQEHIILGSGLDTYANIFPQSDFVGKHNAYTIKYSDLIVDKPHSMYMMIGLSMGILGLVSILLLIATILMRYFNDFGSYNSSSYFVVMLAVMFIAGIFNDSIIPITILMVCFSGEMLSPIQIDEEN